MNTKNTNDVTKSKAWKKYITDTVKDKDGMRRFQEEDIDD